MMSMRARSRAPTTAFAFRASSGRIRPLRGQAGVEAVLGVGGFVFGFVVEEFPLGDDADGGEGLFFKQADGQFDALDELLDQGDSWWRLRTS